jgi:hypothetical protein
MARLAPGTRFVSALGYGTIIGDATGSPGSSWDRGGSRARGGAPRERAYSVVLDCTPSGDKFVRTPMTAARFRVVDAAKHPAPEEV